MPKRNLDAILGNADANIKKFSNAIKENIKGLSVTTGALVASYIVNEIITSGNYWYILAPAGHMLMGPVSVEAGDVLYSSANKGSRYWYQAASILVLNTLFQSWKYLDLPNLPGVSQHFELTKIGFGLLGGAAYAAAKYAVQRLRTTKSTTSNSFC
jgi:hypothetical protein